MNLAVVATSGVAFGTSIVAMGRIVEVADLSPMETIYNRQVDEANPLEVIECFADALH